MFPIVSDGMYSPGPSIIVITSGSCFPSASSAGGSSSNSSSSTFSSSNLYYDDLTLSQGSYNNYDAVILLDAFG
jgi:hypothetical protein